MEAAFLIPVLFLLLLLLLQPGIVLYDRLVMEGAAGDACRMLATRSGVSGTNADGYREAVIRHLGAIPQQENFHMHEGGCSYEVTLSGNEASSEVTVKIVNRIKPLPLVDVGGTLLGLTQPDGSLRIEVEVSTPAQAQWVQSNPLGGSPSAWVKSRE